jgi:hypothetical protein
MISHRVRRETPSRSRCRRSCGPPPPVLYEIWKQRLRLRLVDSRAICVSQDSSVRFWVSGHDRTGREIVCGGSSRPLQHPSGLRQVALVEVGPVPLFRRHEQCRGRNKRWYATIEKVSGGPSRCMYDTDQRREALSAWFRRMNRGRCRLPQPLQGFSAHPVWGWTLGGRARAQK